MATAAQITANRINAQASTGPTTQEGIDATKHNATQHGLSGNQIVIKGENPAGYDQLRAGLRLHYAPANVAESLMVDQLAQSWWRLDRARRIEAQLHNELGELAIFTDEKAMKKYVNFTRHRNAVERAWRHSLRELEKLQAARAKQEASAHHAEAVRTYLAKPSARSIGSALHLSTAARVARQTPSCIIHI